MKTITAIMAIAISSFFATTGYTQSSIDSLRKYCKIDRYAEFILRNASYQHTEHIQMSEYTNDTDSLEFAAGMSIYYNWSHIDIPLRNIANDVWSLVSKQLTGEAGILTVSKANFIITKDTGNNAVLAIIMWNKWKSKWVLMSLPLFKVRILYKGARMFAAQS